MDEPQYNLIFYGEIASGQDVEIVKKRFATLYKAELSKIEKRFFTEYPVVIKSNISYNDSIKYKTIIERTGAVCQIESKKSQFDTKNEVDDAKYKVLFLGRVVDGHDMSTVKKNISQLYKISMNQCENLFSGKEVVLKKNIDYTTAKKFQQIFAQKGAICEIISANEESTTSLPKDNSDRDTPQTADREPSRVETSQISTITSSAISIQDEEVDQKLERIDSLPAEKSFKKYYFDLKPHALHKIMTTVSESNYGEYIIGGFLKWDFSYLQIGIPLWFNMFWLYLLFTTKGVLLVVRTQWRGIKPPRFIPYSELQKMIFRKVGELTCEIIIQANDSKDFTMKISKFWPLFIEDHILTIKKFAPDIVIEFSENENKEQDLKSMRTLVFEPNSGEIRSLKWYENKITTHILLFFVYPVGLYALWKSPRNAKWWKIAATIIFGMIFIQAWFNH